MAARRICGGYSLRIKLLDSDRYNVSISQRGRRVTTFEVVPPASSPVALDHATAFDQAAHAAMSFFSVEETFDDAAAETSETGWLIRRRR